MFLGRLLTFLFLTDNMTENTNGLPYITKLKISRRNPHAGICGKESGSNAGDYI